MYLRESYLDIIRPQIGQQQIKAVTGMRGSGKTSLLKMVQGLLLASAVPEDNIIYLDLEQAQAADISSGQRLLSYVQYRMISPGIHFVLLDEISQVEGWPDAVMALAGDSTCDLFLADSAGASLIAALTDCLPGRFMEIPVLPLSLSEFYDFGQRLDTTVSFERLADRFMEQGGLPILLAMDDADMKKEITLSLYRSILLNDVVLPGKIRDVSLLLRIMRFVLSRVGQVFAVKSIYDDLIRRGQRASAETIANHLKALEGSGLLFRVPRRDLKTRAVLHNNAKYFLADHHLLRIASGLGSRNLQGVWQNIIFLELVRRGYSVFVAKTGSEIVDFWAERDGECLLIQMPDRRRSKSSLAAAAEKLAKGGRSFGKLIVTADRPDEDAADGVPCLGLSDFLIRIEWPRKD